MAMAYFVLGVGHGKPTTRGDIGDVEGDVDWGVERLSQPRRASDYARLRPRLAPKGTGF